MAEVGMTAPMPRPIAQAGWLARRIASPGFQAWAARFPLTRPFVRREGAALFDLVAGFCHSQVLMAFVTLDLPARLLGKPQGLGALARACDMPPERMEVLLSAAAALGLVKQHRDLWRLTMRGAALAGVPGLRDMIRHHDVLYRDLSDPVAFFRGETETELAAFWPYVFGAGAANDPAAAERYSRLMADSQSLVAADTLDLVDLRGLHRLLDIGGGTGAFLEAAGQRVPALALSLFDLPAVIPAARVRFDAAGMAGRITLHSGSFRDDPLPRGADAISLIRVLYDHSDETVLTLLRAVHAALPAGGRVIVSEPMRGHRRPERAGDVYFALYCMAMRTGKARSPDEIVTLLAQAGFAGITAPRTRRPFVTTVLTAVRGN